MVHTILVMLDFWSVSICPDVQENSLRLNTKRANLYPPMSELSLLRKIGYSVGAFGMSLVTYSTMQWIMYLYAPTKDLSHPMLVPSVALMGVAMMVGRVVDAIVDPIIGSWSDRTRTRWGRRKPFMVLGTLPLAITFILMWNPLRSTVSMANFLYITLMLSSFFFFFTVVICPYLALLPEIVTTSEERVSLAAYQAVFNLLGLGAGLIASSWLVGAVGFRDMGLILGLISLISFYIPVVSVAERTDWDETDTGLPFKKALLESFKNRPFLYFILAMFFMFITVNITIAVIPYFAAAVLLEEEAGTGASVMSAVMVLMAMIFFPVVVKLSNRWGKKKVLLVSLALLAALLPLMTVVGHIPAIPLFYQGLVFAALLGIPLASLFVLPYAMLADITDYDEERTGYRREGMYFGVQGLFVKGALGVSAITLAYIMETFGYSVENPLGVVLTWPISAIFVAASFLFLWKYPLD